MLMQESTLLRLAERQAGREEELLAAKQKVAELEAELGDLQREVELRQEQEQALKEVGRLCLLAYSGTSAAWARKQCVPNLATHCCDHKYQYSQETEQ